VANLHSHFLRRTFNIILYLVQGKDRNNQACSILIKYLWFNKGNIIFIPDCAMHMLFNRNTTGAISGSRIAYPFGAPEFIPSIFCCLCSVLLTIVFLLVLFRWPLYFLLVLFRWPLYFLLVLFRWPLYFLTLPLWYIHTFLN